VASSIHSPLGLVDRLHPPDTRLDALPLFTVLLIAIMLSFASSRFIYAPGLTVSLHNNSVATVGPHTNSLNLPRSNVRLSGEMTGATLVVPMLTARSDTMVFFNGRMFSATDLALRRAMAKAAEKSSVLLLKMDRSVTMDRYFVLCDYAREAGFAKIQIAGESNAVHRSPLPPSQKQVMTPIRAPM
jgi:biopolymer transport protein ExbD